MATLAELEARYLDATPDDPQDSSPPNRVFRGARSHVIKIVDGANYFNRLLDVMNRAVGSGDAIYIVGWAFPWSDLKLGNKELKELLAEKAAAGVDVRLIFWAEEAVSGWGEEGVWNGLGLPWFKKGELVRTMHAALDLRMHVPPGANAPPLDKRVLLDWSGITTPTIKVGAHHQKSVVVVAPSEDDPTRREIYGFTGGMDLVSYVWADRNHERNHWHDAAVEVRGEAAVAVHDNFRLRWSEAIALPKTEKVWRVLDGDILPTRFPMIPDNAPGSIAKFGEAIPDMRDAQGQPLAAASETSVQVVQTFQKWGGWKDTSLRSGRNHVHRTLSKALDAAQRYVYIEDQYIGGKEFANLPVTTEPSALLVKLLNKPNVKLILVGSHNADWGDISDDLKVQQFADRLAVWRLDGRKPGINPIFVHSKLILIDDEFAMVGSANMANRSLLVDHHFGTDTEISTAVVSNGDWVKNLRVDLWMEHLGESRNTPGIRAEVENLDTALGMWRTGWNTAPLDKLPDAAGLQTLSQNHDPDSDAGHRALLNWVGEPSSTP